MLERCCIHKVLLTFGAKNVDLCTLTAGSKTGEVRGLPRTFGAAKVKETTKETLH